MNKQENNLNCDEQAFANTLRKELRQSDESLSINSNSMTRHLIDARNAKKRGWNRIGLCSGMIVLLFVCLNAFSKVPQTTTPPESNLQIAVLPESVEQVETPQSHLSAPPVESSLQEQIFLAQAERRIESLRQEIENQQKLQIEQQRTFIREELSRNIVNYQAISAFKF